MTGAVNSVPSSDQVPELMNAVWRRGEHRGDGRSRVVRRRRDDRRARRAPRTPSALSGPSTEPGSIIGGSSRVGISSFGEQPSRPVARRRIDELRRRRHGEFAAQLARQPVVQKIGNRAERGGGCR